ncbi:unnamed protein product [Closterium sp. Yama58-4]|nr:unnamed protein product [Closterium sp. Yama58-4]
MADIPQFDEAMELTDEDLEAMELPDDPSGSNIPRARSPTELPASKKPCVDADPSSPHESAAATSGIMEGPAGTPEKPVTLTTSMSASAAAAFASTPSVAVPAHPALMTPGPSSSTPIGPDVSAEMNATALPLVETPPEPEMPRSSRQPAPPPPTLTPPILMTSSRSVVTLLFPEAGADAIRATLISKILAKMKPSLFDCGYVPDARPTNGETMRFAGRSYATICFSWPTEQSACKFLPIFDHPIELAPGRSILVKPYDDPHPDFTTAKANGAPVLSLNHRVEDHATFPVKHKGRLNNKAHITVAQLQKANGSAIGARSATNAFRADPGLLYIGTDMDVEPWTCVACNFECGPALDSALQHIDSAQHHAQLLVSARNKATKEKFLSWSYSTFMKEGGFEDFLKKLKNASRA